MKLVFGYKSLINLLGKFLLLLAFIGFAISFSGCGTSYEQVRILLSNEGNNVTLYIQNGVSTIEDIVVKVETDSDTINKQVNVSTENDKLNIVATYNSDNTTTLTLSANVTKVLNGSESAVFKDTLVTVSTKEGNKYASFYVSVEIALNSIAQTTEVKNLYAVKGGSISLNTDNLLKLEPQNTTQKDISFSLLNPSSYAEIKGSILTIDENYFENTIQIVAESDSDSEKSVILTLDVIEPLTEDKISYSAFYTNGIERVNLNETIKIATNLQEKNYIILSVSIQNTRNVRIEPYMQSSGTGNSRYASVVQISKTPSEINNGEIISEIIYVFKINAESLLSGTEVLLFDISYTDYNYILPSKEFNLEIYDAVSDITVLVDFGDGNNISPQDYDFVVYDLYHETFGLKINALIYPTTVPDSDKILILKLETNASDYIFYDANGFIIQFDDDNEFEFPSGENIFVKAKSGDSLNAIFIIHSKTDNKIFKSFNMRAQRGASNLNFTNATEINNQFYYYLTSNEVMDKKVEFTVNNAILSDIKIATVGNSFEFVSPVYQGTNDDSFYFYIKSIKDMPDELGTLTIFLKNGLSAGVYVEVFAQLDESKISVSITSSQYNPSIGHKEILSQQIINSEKYNVEFSVALQNTKSASLSVLANSRVTLNYTFYDLLLEGSAYDQPYIDFNAFSEVNGNTIADNYLATSSIIRSLFLNNLNEINAIEIGKVWVRAQVKGYALNEDGVKIEQSYYFYFLVEVYNPIKTFALSKSAVSLYSLKSVGDSHRLNTFEQLVVLLNSDATYNNIVWTNSYTDFAYGENSMSHILNNETIFTFTNNINNILVEAFSTLYSYDSMGQKYYAYSEALTFEFVAKVTEFGRVKSISLKLTIKKAEQVKHIVIDNLNMENGIYLELDYTKDIRYLILARADNGPSSPKPLNDKLVYEFIPDGSTSPSLLLIDRSTGLITVKKEQTTGGFGMICIAPADRYINNLYEPGENDIAIYIRITVADGRSRETGYRIGGLSDITNPLLHYILMNNTEIISASEFGIFETFSGGLYGSVSSGAFISTIVTNKTLFKTLTSTAIVEDLIICGNISESYNGFVAEINDGKINNVTVDTNSQGGTYSASLLMVTGFAYAGGIVGENLGNIENSNFYGKIIAENSIAGGIAGLNEGIISYCAVEFYNFADNEYASIMGGGFAGGLVGEMANGTLKFSYAYSYVGTGDPKNYINLGVLSGSDFGGLAGLHSGGIIDVCFAYINDTKLLIGQSALKNEGSVENAYLIYNINNTSLDAFYVYYGTEGYNYNNIGNDVVWKSGSASVNFGYPYFKTILQESTIVTIGTCLNQNLIDMISVESKSVIYYYESNTVLTKQETTVINSLNTISFASLLGTTDVSGIRAISSNHSIIGTYSNGIVINNTGTAILTIFSKYDYSIAKTFVIYVVYPTLNFKLSYENNQFDNGSIINSKLNTSLNIHGNVDESVVLVDRTINFTTNNINVIFNSYSSYITGSGKGGFVFDTQRIYDDTGLTELEIEYTLNLVKLPSKFIIFNSGTNEFDDINSIFSEYFGKYFVLKLYKGADNLILTSSGAEIEPSDNYKFEAYVFSDITFDVNEGVYNGEGLSVNVFNAKMPETPYEILNTEISGDRKAVYYYIGQNQTVMFVISLEHIGTVYYLSSTNLNEQTDDEMLAVYYQHKFAVSITIAESFKNYNFDDSQYLIKIYALSSLENAQTYNSDVLSKDFNLTVKSQSVLSIDANHYPISSRNLQVIDNNNVIIYKYQPQTNSVLTPGGEGLLAIDLYPVYANFDYLTVIYQASVGDYQLRLASLSKQGDNSYIKNTRGFTNLPNGIKINNVYSYDEFNTTSLTNLYLSTFVSENIDRDLVFTITITAYNNADDQIGVSISFNIIVQYLKSASVSVQDKDGKTLNTVVRGATEYLIIVVDSEQNLGTINFKGRRFTSDSNNLISYSNFTEIHNQSNGTKTFKASLYIGTGLLLENDSNYFSIEVTISWVVNGKMQVKTTELNIGVVDFTIESILLKTDKLDKTVFTGYIGIQNTLKFDFIVKDFLTPSLFTNPAFQAFYANSYYKDASGLNSFGDYIVNYGFENVGGFIGNLYYVRQSTHLQVLNPNGTFASDSHFTFVVEEDGTIKIVGKQAGNVSMLLSIPVKWPSFNKNTVQYIDFYFTINIELYSDEDTPLIIDSEDSFYNALSGENPQNYILMTDLFLTDYTPADTTGISSLDGNNYVIHILNWNLNPEGSTLKLALFNNVIQATTLKNIIVNVYHASMIAVDTLKYSSINVAGLAIYNAGIIYNCHVLAYREDYSKPEVYLQGLNINYSAGQIDTSRTSRLAGFVLENTGSIINSRVGGESVEFALYGNKELLPFNLVAQGNIAGFVYINNGSIASSYFSNGTVTNNTSSGIVTFTAGFAGTNNGSIQISYAKGVGQNEFSLSEGGISTASISAGFTYTNKGNIGDCYSNIILTTANNATKTEYTSGRLTSGFVYINEGRIERCYTASKIEDAKTTQMNFIGVNERKEMLNTGVILNSYYFNIANGLEDAYTTTNSNISVRRILEPDLSANFYGLTFADSAQALNGVWFITSNGPELISANQIAVSCRYLAEEKRDAITGALVSYSLPYYENYEYGSVLNPIIIRNAFELNRVFGGDHLNAGTAISKYYNLSQKKVFGNYRVVTNINLSDLLTDGVSGVKINSSNMILSGGMLDGNMFSLYGLELVAQIEEVASDKNYGMFAGLENHSIIMNLQIEVIGVNAVTIQNVGSVAGLINNSKLVNLVLYSGNTLAPADVIGRNMVGGVAGKVIGESEIKNVTATSISVVVDHVATGTSQRYNRDETQTNSNVSYAGGIAGVVDIYKNNAMFNLEHNERLINPQLAFLTVNGSMRISGSTVGGITGYLGPQTLLKDATLELSINKGQKLIAYNFSAGGIVGECYGDLDMIRTQHEYSMQTTIENNVSEYYSNPNSSSVERGNLSLFEHEEIGKYTPKYIGGLVGELITGNISHSYSKIPVRNTKALYAGGVVGAVTFAESKSINNIDFYEVYTFSDVSATLANGGIVGYIDQTRTLHFDKVNAVNYWTLHKNERDNIYYLPASYYDIYAMTGTKNIEAKYIIDILDISYGNVRIKTGLSRYNLPIISQEVHNEDVYAMSHVKFNYNGGPHNIGVNKSYASLGSMNFFEIIDESQQSIIPLFDYKGALQSGEEMDAYFRNSDWDPNYWKRYQTDMLPRLITSADVNIFYIYIAQDLMNMIYYPDATFIVVGLNGNGIVKVGNYIKNTGWSLNNFSGVLKGYDNSGNYGFDFEGYSLTFINSTITGSKIYNLTLKDLGSSGSQYQEGVGSFVGSAVNTEFENLTFINCLLYAYATNENSNIGLLCGHVNGGFISNISFEDCSVNVFVNDTINTLNVGLMAGLITTPANAYMQIADITAYMSVGNINSSIYNDIRININGNQVTNINAGTIAGSVDGAVFLNYTSKTVVENRTKNLGVSDTAGYVFSPDTVLAGENYYGVVLDITGSGTVSKYNAGIGFGVANVLNLSYLRSTSALKIAGAIISTGSVSVGEAVLGGYVGKSLTSSVINNGSGSSGNYMYIDCDIKFTAGSTTAGMLIGEASIIYSLKNVDTYGTINVNSKTTSSYIGGIVGKLNSDMELKNCISRTAIEFRDEVNDASAIGGFIGFIATPNSKVLIGEDFFASKYLGTMKISANKVFVGGIVGAVNAMSAGEIGISAGTHLSSAVFGGQITIDATEQAYVGGIIGATNYNDGARESIKLIENCFSYGSIYINEDFSDNGESTYAGGIIGRGSQFTNVNSNYSALTVYTKYTQTQSALTVNAVVGQANGSVTENDLTGFPLTNYYSHQLSLCLDNSGISAENVYYYTKTSGSTTMFDVIQLYTSRLGQKDLEQEAYLGSKLSPFLISNQKYAEIAPLFADPSYKNIKYFVISGLLDTDKMKSVELYKSFIIGDGFTLRTTERAVFSKVDEFSTVTGITVKAEIKSDNTTYYTKQGSAYYGAGTLADINNGFIYSCNASEQLNARNYGVYGMINSASGASVYVGGLIGVNTGFVSDCFANLDVAGASSAGGFTGLNLGVISHSYSNGTTSSNNSYSFASNSNPGSIFYCYTASMSYTATVNSSYEVNVTANSGVNPFGSGKIENCYYDIYAVNCSDSVSLLSITDKMAVADEDNFLPYLGSNVEDPTTGKLIPKVFLADEDNVNDTAKIKFGYDYRFNNGYLSFVGPAYITLPYMQDIGTGNGLTEDTAIEITNPGKLQQINDALPSYYYVLVRDIVVIPAMISSAADADITNWLAIGTSSNKFNGKISGKYTINTADYRFSISGLVMNASSDYSSVFGLAENAKISNINIDSITINGNADYSAGFISYGNNVDIFNINLGTVNLTYNSSSQVYMGGFAGSLSGTSKIENCFIQSVAVQYLGAGSKTSSYLGGLVGRVSGNVEILNCEINGKVDLSYDSTGGAYLGGIAGFAEGATSNALMQDITIRGNVNISNELNANSTRIDYFGAMAGYTNFVSFQSININGNKNTFINNVGGCCMGGWIGQVDDDTNLEFSSISISATNEFTVSSGNTNNVSSYIGGLFGKINNLTLTPSQRFNLPNNKFNYESDGCIPYIGGFAGSIENTELSKIGVTFNNNQISFYSSSEVYMGGLIGSASGESSVEDCSVSYASNAFTFSISQKIEQAHIGGLVGITSNKFTLSECNISQFNINDLFVGSGEVGGLIANANSELNVSSSKLSNSTFTVKSVGEVALGGIVGKLNSTNAVFNECEGDRIRLSVSEGTTAKVGGIIGNTIGKATLTDCILKGAENPLDVSETFLKYTAIAGSSNSYIGGIIGDAVGNAVDAISLTGCEVSQNCNLLSENQTSTSGVSHLGGIAGHTLNTKIGNNNKVLNLNSVYVNNGFVYIGGIIGKAENSSIGAEDNNNPVRADSISLILASGQSQAFTTTAGAGIVGGIAGWIGDNSTVKYSKVEGESVVINGSTSSAQNSGSVGGIVGYSDGNSIVQNVSSTANVASYCIAGGIVGAGNATISYATNAADTVFTGRVMNVSGYSLQFNNLQTTYAGGIISKLDAGTISYCNNNANVYAGYKEEVDFNGRNNPRTVYGENTMKGWNIGDGGVQINNGSVNSYAGGIAGYSGSTAQIKNSNNYGNIEAKAKEILVTRCSYYSEEGWFGWQGNHKIYECYTSECAYASGISYIENGTSLNSCYNEGQVKGGWEVGFNFAYNTAYFGLGDEKFFLLKYGTRSNSKYNTIYDLYSTDYSDEILDHILQSNVIRGMAIYPDAYMGVYTYENLFYANMICNNPNASYQTFYLSGYSFNRAYSSGTYNYYNQVINCTYSGNINKILLPETFNELNIIPESGGSSGIDWPTVPSNQPGVGVPTGLEMWEEFY